MLLGIHTLPEANALLASLDFRVQKLAAALATIPPGLQSAADKQDTTLTVDWKAFLDRWNAMKQKVYAKFAFLLATNPALAVTETGRALITDEGDYQDILNASSPTHPAYTPKDLGGLESRIQTLLPNNPIDYSGQPAQESLDVDLTMYQTAKGAIDAGERAGSNWWEENRSKVYLGGVGLLATLVVLRRLKLL